MKLNRILSVLAAGAAGCSNTKKSVSSEVDPLAPKTAPQNVTFDWQEPFETVIMAFKTSDRCTDTSMFEIRDLTGDDIPELIISPSDDVASKCEVYRLIGSRADLITNAGSYGTISPQRTLSASHTRARASQWENTRPIRTAASPQP